MDILLVCSFIILYIYNIPANQAFLCDVISVCPRAPEWFQNCLQEQFQFLQG